MPTRIVAGIMSGTSLDGVDAVVARLEGSGPGLTSTVLGAAHHPYPEALRTLLLQNSHPDTSSVDTLARLNVRLPDLYAEAVFAALDDAGLDRDALDAVGMHGQTVQHLPEPADCGGAPVRATLQIGDPSTLAQLLGTTVVGNFRAADVAQGGEGAPLVPYFDYVTFAAPDENRLLLNLGGIANLTWLPAGAGPEDVRAFDTGPGNMVMDVLADHYFGAPYDPDGQHAAAGTPDHDLLADLLGDPFFREPPPKSTGRERFGTGYADRLRRAGEDRGLNPDDLLATATLLTAASVYQAYARFLREDAGADAVLASGGGVHNPTLLQMLTDAFAPIPVRTTAADGIDPDLKEALCFAVLAHETLNDVPTNLPAVTGAREAVVLGVIARG